MLAVTIPRALPSNLSHQESIDKVRHLYPNLGPALESLVAGYQKLVDSLPDDYATAQADKDLLQSCPHCGSQLKLTQ